MSDLFKQGTSIQNEGGRIKVPIRKGRLRRVCTKCNKMYFPTGRFCKVCPDCKHINPLWARLLRIQKKNKK